MFKILIRPLVISDAAVSWKWRNDPEVWKRTGRKHSNYITEEIEKKWLQAKVSENDSARFAITVDDLYIGNIQLTSIVKNENAEYHVFIGDKKYWRKGVSHIATNQILFYAKEVLKLKEIYLSVRKDNISAVKSYLRSSFEKASEIDDWIKMKCNLVNLKSPTVSVFMMAYNHEKYISEAIEGVLIQKATFDFEIVIGEDCSTDNTREIILSYQEKYPGKFKLLLHKQNVGAMANQNAVFAACKGKYIAMCEGDDYWTDPLKLQKQVDFLEGNEEFSLCFHNSEIFYENSDKPPRPFNINKLNKNIIKTEDLINNKWMVPTESILLRKELLDHPKWFSYIYNGDFALQLILSTKGPLYYINETMSRRRRHGLNLAKHMKYNRIDTRFKKLEVLLYFNMYSEFIFNENISKWINNFKKESYKIQVYNKPLIQKLFNIDFYLFKISALQKRISKNADE